MNDEVLKANPSRVSHHLESGCDVNIDTETQNVNKSPILSDDDEEVFTVIKKRIQTFSDRESDPENDYRRTTEEVNSSNNSDKNFDDDNTSLFNNKKRSRIKKIQNSDSENGDSSQESNKKHYESVRTVNKRRNLKERFKNFISKSRDLEKSPESDSNERFDSDNDEYCLQIKEILKTSVNTMKSICDPDTSDDEEDKEEKFTKKKLKSKKVKSTSPKPQRMTAKQATENMQKIKSESNRMLREREVSLPYHRPKALSLKDIMSRRKPAVSSDGKALPIKMNEEQLKQYAIMLEQRQKEVIELCKSDTEDDETPEGEEKFTDNRDMNKTESVGEFEVIADHPVITDINLNDNNLSSNDETLNSEPKEHEVNPINTEPLSVGEKRMQVEDNEIATKLTKNADIEMVFESEKEKQHTISEEEILDKTGELDSSTNVEDESQIMVLQYDSEKVNSIQDSEILDDLNQLDTNKSKEMNSDEEYSYENDINFDEIDKCISATYKLTGGSSDNSKENDETLSIINIVKGNPTPKLTGGPGSFIHLNDSEPSAPRKLSGVEILKERFTYFANLKSSEDMKKDREKKYKPGTQHLKLKQELEQQISEQRSLEWEKRLEGEKQLKSEMNQLSDDDIEKIEAKLDSEEKIEDESSESEEEPIENDVLLVDKPKKRNPMVDDEAEVSDSDEVVGDNEHNPEDEVENEGCGDDEQLSDAGEDADLEDSDESSERSESEEETESKPKKGRILKAFEDSDDESGFEKPEAPINTKEISVVPKVLSESVVQNEDHIKETQDEDLQLAQENKSSNGLLSTQEPNNYNQVLSSFNQNGEDNTSIDLGSQTFSIMNSVNASHKIDLDSPNKMSIVCDTQTQSDSNLDHIVGMCSSSFSQNLVSTQNPVPLSQSQDMGDDIAALCTGKFYDNPFVSQIEKRQEISETSQPDQPREFGENIVALCTGKFYDNPFVSQDSEKDTTENNVPDNSKISKEQEGKEKTILKSILDELDGPDLGVRQNKYFFNSQPKDKISEISENGQKKRFVIDSDDEGNDNTASGKKIKKLKKRRAEQRALRFSDDEEDLEGDSDDYESEKEERIVEYDSEENEVEVQPKLPAKKKRVGDFFENEAELTSEDEWVGSGDEDERGLDMMEREEGDDDNFHQGQLQRELGQIHMREVLDQDKREVRLLQELLFEDGDLGDGHRQRKFRWKNADGDLETGTNPDEFADTQDDEFESEEQWRKQRHEREMFLRKMHEKDEDNLNTTINRTTIIKANLNSRSMSTIISETKTGNTENIDTIVPETKTAKDIPSPKKPFTIFQQNYHGSLLTRGRGALARLAALATPLATDDDAPKVLASTNKRNFVFAAINDAKPKVTKRKAEQVNTPRLIKKMKTEQTSKYLKNSLLDHLKT